ncbi:MAG: Na+/H+ antiporter subunit E [Salinarimonas sp.]
MTGWSVREVSMNAMYRKGDDHAGAQAAQLPVRARERSLRAFDPPGPDRGAAPAFPKQPFLPRSARESALRRRLRRLAWTLVMTTGLWLVLTEAGPDSAAFGIPAIALAGALAFATTPATRWRIAPVAALRFAGWFALQSVLGATDVACRALALRMDLAPGLCIYPLRLPQGAPRVFFANAISLLPGTLSAELEGGSVVVHSLDLRRDTHAELADLEWRVAALFDLLPRAEHAGSPAGGAA